MLAAPAITTPTTHHGLGNSLTPEQRSNKSKHPAITLSSHSTEIGVRPLSNTTRNRTQTGRTNTNITAIAPRMNRRRLHGGAAVCEKPTTSTNPTSVNGKAKQVAMSMPRGFSWLTQKPLAMLVSWLTRKSGPYSNCRYNLIRGTCFL